MPKLQESVCRAGVSSTTNPWEETSLHNCFICRIIWHAFRSCLDNGLLEIIVRPFGCLQLAPRLEVIGFCFHAGSFAKDVTVESHMLGPGYCGSFAHSLSPELCHAIPLARTIATHIGGPMSFCSLSDLGLERCKLSCKQGLVLSWASAKHLLQLGFDLGKCLSQSHGCLRRPIGSRHVFLFFQGKEKVTNFLKFTTCWTSGFRCWCSLLACRLVPWQQHASNCLQLVLSCNFWLELPQQVCQTFGSTFSIAGGHVCTFSARVWLALETAATKTLSIAIARLALGTVATPSHGKL